MACGRNGFILFTAPRRTTGRFSMPADLSTDIDRQRRRLHFRSWHRGTKEMDHLLGKFADAHLDDLPEDLLNAYDVLLEESDPDLYNWITGREPPPDHVSAPLIELMKAFHNAP
jgi:antitoxin CptB